MPINWEYPSTPSAVSNTQRTTHSTQHYNKNTHIHTHILKQTRYTLHTSRNHIHLERFPHLALTTTAHIARTCWPQSHAIRHFCWQRVEFCRAITAGRCDWLTDVLVSHSAPNECMRCRVRTSARVDYSERFRIYLHRGLL